MSTQGYTAKMTFEAAHFCRLLAFLQRYNAQPGYQFRVETGSDSVEIGTTPHGVTLQNQNYPASATVSALEIQMPLPNLWYGTFEYTFPCQLPVDNAFQRYLLSRDFLGRTFAPNDTGRPELLDAGMARIGRVWVSARGLEALKPGYIEVELRPICTQTFLEESDSWLQFLMDAAREAQAFLLYTHVDFSRSTILWHRNKPVHLLVENFDDVAGAVAALSASKALLSEIQR